MYINLFVIQKPCFLWHFLTIIDRFWKRSAQETIIIVRQITDSKIHRLLYIQDISLKDLWPLVICHLYIWCHHPHQRPIWRHKIWNSAITTCRICKEYIAQAHIWRTVYIDVCSSSNLCTKSYLNMIQQYCFTGNKRMAGRSSLDHSYTTKHTVFKSFNLCTKSYLNMIQQYCFTGNKWMAGHSSLGHSYTTKHTVFKYFNLCTKVI